MAFSYTVTSRTIMGNKRVVWGTWTNGANDSGGDIDTGLNDVNSFSVVPTGQVDSSMPKYSASAGTVTLVTGEGVDGNWTAFGN